MSEIMLTPFQPRDREELEKLLAVAELPGEDLTEEVLEDFRIARDTHGVAGAAGIEHYNDVALLRSVVVREDLRGAGLGARLVRAIETHAAEHGVRELYLLTTSAETFFSVQGYHSLAHDVAPSAIRNTGQFSRRCPALSSLMMKDLHRTYNLEVLRC